MDNRELAGRLRDMLTPERWWNGTAKSTGTVCLGIAVGEIFLDAEKDNERRIQITADANQQVLDIIEELFPGRSYSPIWGGQVIPAFNDHPDTTYEDVLLVIKHLEAA